MTLAPFRVAEMGEPARVLHHEVEDIAVDHEIALAVDAGVDGVLHHVDAAEMRAVIFAQKLVVIARHVDDLGALARLAHHVDAAEMRAVIFAQKLVVIARHVDDLGALARLAQHLLHEVIVRLRPVPARLQRPAVDDITHQIDGVGVMTTEEIEQLVGLRAAGSEMDIGDKQSAKAPALRSIFCTKSLCDCGQYQFDFSAHPSTMSPTR